MSKFRDAEGREWKLSLTVGMVTRLRTDAGFELGKASSADRLGEMLFANPETVARVLWVMIERQAEPLGVTPEAFADGLDGPTIEAASTAILEAIIDFFHRAQPAAAMKNKLPEVLGKMDQRITAAMTAAMDSPSSDNAGDLPE